MSRTTEQMSGVLSYYKTPKKDSYYCGKLMGACHFGYMKPSLGDWEQFNPLEAQHNMRELLRESLALPRGACVLDAGSGYGVVAEHLRRYGGYNVYGIDLNQGRVSIADKYARARKSPDGSTNFIVGDYGRIPFLADSMHGVFTCETLCHAPYLEEVLGEFYRVLRPGGRLVLHEYTIPPLEEMNPLAQAIAKAMIKRTGMSSIHRFTHGAFPDILSGIGFRNIDVRDITEGVIPHWRMLFWQAVAENVLPGKRLPGSEINLTNTLASLGIYPTADLWNLWRYNIVSAEKPG
ncbi:MAG: methyltransferase domain-containing protein [Patescibacteria group bacterium]|nr:methyltransferase domain-containing protein [Patescibacteria group bacterium]